MVNDNLSAHVALHVLRHLRETAAECARAAARFEHALRDEEIVRFLK